MVPHLVEESMKSGLPLAEAVREAAKRLEGSYALTVVSVREPDRIVCARKESPLVVGINEGEVYCASDIPAFLSLTKKALIIENGELVVLNGGSSYEIRRLSDWSVVPREPEVVDWNPEMAEKQGYPHFMLK